MSELERADVKPENEELDAKGEESDDEVEGHVLQREDDLFDEDRARRRR